jgi:hypothetical protein
MTEQKPDAQQKPSEPAKGEHADKLKSDAKQERLAEALRANLRRRKVQNRERS